MTDRFANGDTANDLGGLTGGQSTTGYDPTDKGFYHGGDLKGSRSKLDYIKALGTTAIWLTPSFVNKPVQGTPPKTAPATTATGSPTSRTSIRTSAPTPTEGADRRRPREGHEGLLRHHHQPHRRRHRLPRAQYTYRSKTDYPYKDVNGNVFDDRDYVNQPFPRDGPGDVVPVHAVLPRPATRRPSRRRGSTTRSITTTAATRPSLASRSTTATSSVSTTCSPSGPRSWRAWTTSTRSGSTSASTASGSTPSSTSTSSSGRSSSPTSSARPRTSGNDDFFAFGEVFDGNPAVMSEYTTAGKLQATLDFGFQQQGVDFAKGKPADLLADFFAKDDWYTDADSNAYQLPTFLGNHDMGRASMFLKADGAERGRAPQAGEVRRLADVHHAGQPSHLLRRRAGLRQHRWRPGRPRGHVRQQGRPLQHRGRPRRPRGSMDRYDTEHPLYQHVAELSALRAGEPGPRRRRPGRTVSPPTAPASSPPRGSAPAPRAARMPARSSTSWRRTTTRSRRRPPSRPGPRATARCSRRSTAPTQPSSRPPTAR